jgi:hypothetical protein
MHDSPKYAIIIRIFLPILAMILVLCCLLLNGRGWETLEDPVVVIAVLFLIAISCIPLLRRVIFTKAEGNKPSELQQWLVKFPWLGLILIWNGLGGLFALCVILSVIPSVQYLISFPEPPIWCGGFFWLWFMTLPFTTLGVTVFLWRSRGTSMSKALLLYSLVILALWIYLIMMLVAYGCV